MRLIDADKLLDCVDNYQKDNPHEDMSLRMNHDSEYRHFKNLIFRQPTAFDKEKVLSDIYGVYSEINNAVLKTGNYEIAIEVAKLISEAEEIIERGGIYG